MPTVFRNPAAPLLVALTVLAVSPARAQQTSGEVLVSRTGTAPSVAVAGRGDFKLVWVDADGNPGTDILASTLPRGARGLRAPSVVNTSVAGFQVNPDVAADDAGRSVVVWQDGLENARVLGQSFGAAGAPQSSEVRLTHTEVSQQVPQVATAEGGDFVAVWVEDGNHRGAIKAARFSAGGSPLGPELTMQAGGEINTGARTATFPGGFAVGWTEFFECSGGRPAGFIGTIARFNAEGRRAGKVYRAGTRRCEASAEGGALLALRGSRAGALAIFAASPQYVVQRFDPAGKPVGGRFPLSRQACTESRCAVIGTVAMDDPGRFVVVWEVVDSGTYSLAAQLFSPRGKPLTGQVPVTDLPSRTFQTPAAALADDGTLAVAWRRESAEHPERAGLYLRRLRLP
jgi:hypothetical protein